MLCEYGCKKIAQFVLKNGKNCCSKSPNSCSEVTKRNSEGLKNSYNNNGAKPRGFAGIFNEVALKNSQQSRINNIKSQPFEYWGKKLVFDFILKEQNEKCNLCELSPVWNHKPLKFHLDHIDGNNGNNKRENLRLICPNCHSQTETYCGKNTNNGLKKVSDDDLIEALKTSKNIRQALIKVGLTPKGLNYQRAKKLSAQLETFGAETFKVGEGC